MFHQRDNLFFGRMQDGGVRIVKFSAPPHVTLLHGADAVTRPTDGPHADGEFREVKVLLDVRITADEWASIISSMSKAGEADGGFYRALDWHMGRSPAP